MARGCLVRAATSRPIMTHTITTPLDRTRTAEPYDYRPCETTPPSSPDVENTEADRAAPDQDTRRPS